MGRIKKDRERIFSIVVRDEMGIGLKIRGGSRSVMGALVVLYLCSVLMSICEAFHEYFPSKILSCFGLYEVLTGRRHQQLANVYDLVHIKCQDAKMLKQACSLTNSLNTYRKI